LFAREVLASPAIQERLIGISQEPDFVLAVQSIATELGYHLSVADIAEAMESHRRTWLMRYVD